MENNEIKIGDLVHHITNKQIIFVVESIYDSAKVNLNRICEDGKFDPKHQIGKHLLKKVVINECEYNGLTGQLQSK